MMDEYDDAVEIFDEYLAEQYHCDSDAAYERYRDDWSDRLEDAVKELKKEFVDAKQGYYKDRDEKFIEHVIEILKSECKCEVTALGHNVLARRVTNEIRAEIVE